MLPATLFAAAVALVPLVVAVNSAAALQAPAPGPSGTETFLVPVEPRGLRVLLRHQPPTSGAAASRRAPVLFVHGATFPSALAAAFRFDGVSWMDDLAARGFDVWALDFLGYGGSDRYPEMHEPAEAHKPLGRADETAMQIAAAVEFIARRQGVPRVALVAHSWGTIPAGLYTTRRGDRVERLVQFGPVTRRDGPRDTVAVPGHGLITEAMQQDRFLGYVPKGEPRVLSAAHFAVWGPAYMATDSTSGTRTPASVQIPSGPTADVHDAWSGRLAYDPGTIAVPVLIVRGEWEAVTTDADARWLFDALKAAPVKRDVKIDRGTHVMHLERSRHQLYSEVAAFLGGDETPAAAPSATKGRRARESM